MNANLVSAETNGGGGVGGWVSHLQELEMQKEKEKGRLVDEKENAL